MEERNNNLEVRTEGKKLRNVAIVVVVAVLFGLLGCMLTITSEMEANMKQSIADVIDELNADKESTDKKIADIEEKLATYKTLAASETHTTEKLVDLCMKGDYDSLLKVCKCQDTPANVLGLTARKIVSLQYTNNFGDTWEEKDTKITKLVMLVLEHPNCTRSVLIQLIGVDRERLVPILIMSDLNDSGTLMMFAENCRRDSSPRMDWIVLIANHEAATEGVIRELMAITDHEEINGMLQERLNDLQGK